MKGGLNLNLKNYEIINATNAIKDLIKNPDMETKAKWNFIKNLNKFQAIFEDYSKLEIDLIKKYALKDENDEVLIYADDDGEHKKGNPKFAPANQAKYIKERTELLQCDSDVDIHKIKLDDLPSKIEDGTLLLLCSFLIED